MSALIPLWAGGQLLFLFMSVFTQALFTLVRGHFMPFSFFAAWHGIIYFLIR